MYTSNIFNIQGKHRLQTNSLISYAQHITMYEKDVSHNMFLTSG